MSLSKHSADPIVIVSAARTPMGAFQGELSPVSAAELGSIAIQAAVSRAGISAEQVDEVIMGCVLPAGQGQAPARQAAIGAELSLSATCTTINKVCGSGMKATMLAHDLLLAESAAVIVAGGMESMTNAPYLLPKARSGYRMGNAEVIDHMFLDGLQDAYSDENRGKLMGVFAEQCAREHSLSRQAQDDYAIASTQRAQQAMASGAFDWELTPVTVKTRKGEVLVSADEQPPKAKIDKIPQLKPAFLKDGTVTAANSSSISDGAAALVLMRASAAEAAGLTPVAKIIGHTSYAGKPAQFPAAPVDAISQLLEKLDWSAEEVDIWEINEAFAAVAMIAMQQHQLPHDKVNIHGGACALGHPIGASGARIIVTLLGALKQTGGKRGVAAICIGGGEATAIGVELL